MQSDIINVLNILKLMPLPLTLLIVSNLLLITGFVVGKIALYKNENAVKFFAYFSVAICVLFAIYFISIIWFCICNLLSGQEIYSVIFLVFLFLPFIIGRFATYEKVHFYTNIQILTLIAGLIPAFWIIINFTGN